jgi:hypothetical protein
VPIIGGHGACLDQVARSVFHLNAEAGSFSKLQLIHRSPMVQRLMHNSFISFTPI